MDREICKSIILNDKKERKDIYEELKSYILENIPVLLFRYYPFNKYWRDIIFNGQLKLSKITAFNDIFEGRTFYNRFNLTYRMRRMLSIAPPPYEPEYYALRSFIYSADPATYNKKRYAPCKIEWAENVINRAEKELEHYSIVCFSENDDSILMWSHYSDCHKGFCIAYNTRVLLEKCDIIYPIIYDNNLSDESYSIICEYIPSVEGRGGTMSVHPDTKSGLQVRPLLFKTTDWSYEHEWRIIMKDTEFISASDAISHILLGALAKKEHNDKVDEITAWAKSHNKLLYQVSAAEQQNTLLRVPIYEPYKRRGRWYRYFD